jgi:hypothetical protein
MTQCQCLDTCAARTLESAGTLLIGNDDGDRGVRASVQAIAIDDRLADCCRGRN